MRDETPDEQRIHESYQRTLHHWNSALLNEEKRGPENTLAIVLCKRYVRYFSMRIAGVPKSEALRVFNEVPVP